MFVHYIKIAIRNLWKYRLQTIISLIGLSVGMACFALSALWLQYIESYDDFVKDNDRLYMLSPGQNGFEPDSKEYGSLKSVAEALKKTCSEIEDVYSYGASYNQLASDEGEYWSYEGIFIEDEKFLNDLVDLNIRSGRLPKDCGTEIAISTTLANQLLGTEDVIGKNIIKKSHRGDGESQTIVGVFDPLPNNTSIFREKNFIKKANLNESQNTMYNLIKVYPGVDIDALSEKIRHSEVRFTATYYHGTTEELQPDMTTYSLLPLRKLRSDYPPAFNSINGDNLRIVVLISIITIISVLCHYFITMITLIRIRCRALALRRMLGSSVMGIVGMNIVETLILFITSSIIGATAIYFMYPTFIQYSYLYTLSTEYLVIAIAKFWSIVLMAGLLLTIVATLITIRKTQHTILHGHQSHQASTKLDTVANMIQQTVSLSILFCIGTIVMQISFLKKSADLGFEHKDRISISECPNKLRDYVLSLPEVVDSYEPREALFPRNCYSPYRMYPSEEANEYTEVIGLEINQAAIDFWGMTILDGRVPENEIEELMVNEALAKHIGDSVVGRHVRLGSMGNEPQSYTIVGILKDTYDCSVLTQPKPCVFRKELQWTAEWQPLKLSLCVKVKEGTIESDVFAKIWACSDSLANSDSSIERPRSINSMSLQFETIMRNENLLFDVLMIIAGCTLMTTLFGVFSLLSLSLEQRKKEMALRKIHGATIRQVIMIFLRKHILTLAISSAISFPIAYILMQKWLSVYVRQIPFPWYLGFVIFAGMGVLIFLTIIWKIRNAVKQNPVEVIKNE